MDENQEKEKEKKGAVDYINQGYNKGKDAYNVLQKLQGGVRIARGTQFGTLIAEGASNVELYPIYAVALAFGILLLLVLVMIFGGGSKAAAAPTCQNITADSVTTTPGTPITITIDGCSIDNPIFSWTSSATGGTFTPTDTQSTLYTPPGFAAYPATITITANVCNPSVQTQCTQSVIEVTVAQATCKSLGGVCATRNLCTAEGNGTISGSSDCGSGVCCSFTPKLKFLCQYSSEVPGCHIDFNGCVPTSVAMIVDTFGLNFTPSQIALANGGAGCSVGSDVIYDFRGWLVNHGFKVTGSLTNGIKLDLSLVQSYLNQGYYVLGEASINFWGNSGTLNPSRSELHAIVIVAVNGNNLTVYDPTYCENGKSGGLRTLRDVNNLGGGDVGKNGWFHTVAIIKN